jgi:hypothetical protein
MNELAQLQWHAFKNNSGETIPAYAILRLTGMNTINGLTYLTADKPNASETAYAVNGPNQVPSGKYGQCVLSGICVFAYDTGSPAFNDSYSAKNAQWTANKTGSLIKCLGIVDSTNKFALGIIGQDGGTSTTLGILDEDLTYGGTATVSVWEGEPNAEADSGDNVECYTWLLESGYQLSTGFHVEMVKGAGGKYRVIACRECPVIDDYA